MKGHLRDRHYLEEVGVDSNLILRHAMRNRMDGCGLDCLAEDRDERRS